MSTVATLFIPGMTLNGTVFPALPGATDSVDFNTMVLSPTGSIPPHPDGPMGPYLDRLDERFRTWPAWRSAGRRIVVAHSFGGMLLLTYLLHPHRHADIDGIVLVSTTAGPMFAAVGLRLPLGLRIPARPVIPLWNRPIVTRAVKRLVHGTLDVERVDFRTLTDRSDGAVDRAGWRNTDWRAMRSFRLAMRGYDVRARLSAVELPATVIFGGRDTLFAPARGRELVRGLPHAEERFVPEAGHALPLTHGEVVADAVDRMLVGLEAG